MARSKTSSQEPKPAVDPASFTGYFRGLFQLAVERQVDAEDYCSSQKHKPDYTDACGKFAMLDEIRDYCCGRARQGNNSMGMNNPLEVWKSPKQSMPHAFPMIAKIIIGELQIHKAVMPDDDTDQQLDGGPEYRFSALFSAYENSYIGGTQPFDEYLATRYCCLESGDIRVPSYRFAKLAVECRNDAMLKNKLRRYMYQFFSDAQSQTDYGRLSDTFEKRLERTHAAGDDDRKVFSRVPAAPVHVKKIKMNADGTKNAITERVIGDQYLRDEWCLTSYLRRRRDPSAISHAEYNLAEMKQIMMSVEVDWPDREDIEAIDEERSNRPIVEDDRHVSVLNSSSGRMEFKAPKLQRSSRRLIIGKGTGEKAQIVIWMKRLCSAADGSLRCWDFADMACVCHPVLITDSSFDASKMPSNGIDFDISADIAGDAGESSRTEIDIENLAERLLHKFSDNDLHRFSAAVVNKYPELLDIVSHATDAGEALEIILQYLQDNELLEVCLGMLKEMDESSSSAEA